MIVLERLATAQVHFAALLLCRPVQVVIIHRLERLIQLWNVLTLHTTTLTHLVTATSRPAPVNPEDFTSTPFRQRMVTNDPSHPNECFPPHHHQHQVAITIFTQMVETLHRSHHLPTKFITADENEIVRWLHELLRCVVTNSPTEHMVSAYVSRAEGKRVSFDVHLERHKIYVVDE